MKKSFLPASVLTAVICSTAWAQGPGSNVKTKPTLESYFKIQAALTSDSIAGIPENARTIAKDAVKDGLPKELVKEAEALSRTHDLAEAREKFKALSNDLAAWAERTKPQGVHVAYCPMVKASWLQQNEQIKNPYYGQNMLSCGVLKM